MNFNTLKLLCALSLTAVSASLAAQPEKEPVRNKIHERSSFSIDRPYKELKISRFSIIYQGDNDIMYNLMNREVYSSAVSDFFINPTGASIAVISQKGKSVMVVSNRTKDEVLSYIKEDKRVNPLITEKESPSLQPPHTRTMPASC